MTIFIKRTLTALFATALACSIAPLAAAAAPGYAQGTTIHGTILSINGKYNISVADVNGYVDNVSLHDGTIINPTGLTLVPGQPVTIFGTAAGSTFEANQINTPYPSYGYHYVNPVYVGPMVGVGVRLGGPGWAAGFRGGF
jgi:hypothetical protein